MDHGIGRVNQTIVVVAVQAELRRREVPRKNPDAGLEILVEAWEVHVQLHSVPQAERGFLRVFPAHQHVQGRAMRVQQVGRDMRANVARRSGQEYRHVAPFVPVFTVSACAAS